MFFLAQLTPYSPPIIPVISFVICHPFFPVYFLSFILYSSQSSPIFVHLFSDYPLSFTPSHTTPFPHRLFTVIYKLAVNFTPNFSQSIPSHFQTYIIVCENLMKNDRRNGSLRSRDNRWGVGIESIQIRTFLPLLIYILLKVCVQLIAGQIGFLELVSDQTGS